SPRLSISGGGVRPWGGKEPPNGCANPAKSGSCTNEDHRGNPCEGEPAARRGGLDYAGGHQAVECRVGRLSHDALPGRPPRRRHLLRAHGGEGRQHGVRLRGHLHAHRPPAAHRVPARGRPPGQGGIRRASRRSGGARDVRRGRDALDRAAARRLAGDPRSLRPPCRSARAQREERLVRFIILVKATADSEAGRMPSERLLAEMGAFHEEMAKAGVLVDGSGLKPSRTGWRIRYGRNGARSFVDGPFTETKELVAGYTIIDVKSREEALVW